MADVPTKPADSVPEQSKQAPVSSKSGSKMQALRHFFLHTIKGRSVGIVLLLLAVFGGACAVPVSRYAMFGLVLKKTAAVQVMDQTTGKPVSQVIVTIAGRSATTGADGVARITDVPVGRYTADISKQYYTAQRQELTVPILSDATLVSIKLVATGRQVPVSVVNRLSSAPLAGASIEVLDTSATTDEKGEAVIVVPAGNATQKAKVSLKGYYQSELELTVTEQKDDKNTIKMTPEGEIYFLSKRSGKINVMKSRLDGSNQQVVLEGTGKEDDSETVLLASRDWKYLALHARREGTTASLYLITTATGTMTTIDKGEASFNLIGWQNDYFAYGLVRHNVKEWQNGRYAIKSFHAPSGKLSQLDESQAQGTDAQHYSGEAIVAHYIVGDQLVYLKYWNAGWATSNPYAGKQMTINAVKPDGSGKKVVKGFDATQYSISSTKLYEPGELYFALHDASDKRVYFEYEDGQVKEVKDVTDDTYNKFYPTYLLSPSGSRTFWYEPRDGKNTLFTGNASGKEAKEIASLSPYVTHGWYTDEYLLLSKDGSELYVQPREAASPPVKITDYHKPALTYPGYGYGYGGL